jgi:uncharacterized protein (DUF2235 family)
MAETDPNQAGPSSTQTPKEHPEANSNSAFPTWPPKKKLIVCCDGTWNDSDSPELPLTNVARIARCITELHENGSAQIVYYQSGVGTGRSKIGNVVEGATGIGM